MSEERESLRLPADTVVGRYLLHEVQTAWGFYLTYSAEETGTGKRVLVHELLPEELVDRVAGGTVRGKTEHAEEALAWARERFVMEGRGLAACTHPAIQKILAVFEANGTAYWVTPPDEGRNLKRWLQDLGRASTEAELRTLLGPLLSALQQAHAARLHHLNLKLDTIQIGENGKPLLVHFAGSRQAIAQHSHAASAVTTGYSPIEQYDPDKTEGPWTDIYSLAAVLHRAITGQVPPESTLRLKSDPYQRLAGRYSGQYSAALLTSIDAALAPDAVARPQSIEGWRKILGIPGEGRAMSFVRRSPRKAAVCATAGVILCGVVLWQSFRPKPVPPIDDDSKDHKKVVVDDGRDKKKDDQKQAEEEKKKIEEEKKAEAAKMAEEQRKMEEQKLAEEQKKADEDKMAAEKAAAEKVAAEKQAEENAAQKSAEEKAMAEKAEAAKTAAEQAAKKADEAKNAAKKQAADKAAAEALAQATEAQNGAGKAATEKAAAEITAKQAGVEKAAAERTAAEKAVTLKTIEEQLAASAVARKTAEAKVATDQAAADKAAAGKSAAEQAAEKIGEEKAAAQQVVIEKTAAEKTAAEKLAAAVAAQKALEANADPQKAVQGKAEADKAAAEMAARKVAEEKEAADKDKDNSSQGQKGGPPPPPPPMTGQVGSGLGGIWETTGKNESGNPLKKLIMYPDAHYELTSGSGTDTGIVRAKLGIISMDSEKTGTSAASTFKYKSMSVIETDGALGKLEWVRVSATTPERVKEEKK